MKRRNASKKDDVFNAGDKAICNETAREKGQTMDKGMDKEERVDEEKTQERL